MATFDLQDYEAQYARHYTDASFERVMVAVRRRRVLQSIGAAAGARVLEVGCGMEPVVAELPRAATRTVVEPAAQFAEAARRALAGQPGTAVFEAFFEDAVESDAVAGQFDVIIVSSLLHEVAEPRRLLRAVRRVAADDALVHVNVPNVRSLHRVLAVSMGLIDDVFEPSATERRFQRHTRFDRDSLVAMLRAEGFEVQSTGSYFVKPFTHDQMQRALDAGVIDERVIRGLEAVTAQLPDLGAELYADVRPS
ncbi:MAG TPA: methyltransferase domain-containing protein [Gemmatimonadaceae bacterium]|nr:methyltransferase domain-containing protein [Gemmatimonadaceae bacterium]